MSSYIFGSTFKVSQATQNILTYQTERAALIDAHFYYIIEEFEKKIQHESRCLGKNSFETSLSDFPLINHTKAVIDIVPLSNTERSAITVRISDHLDKIPLTHNITPQMNNYTHMKISWPTPENTN